MLDRRLAESEYVAGPDYTIADMAIWPWYGQFALGKVYGDAGTFLQTQEYRNLVRWAETVGARAAVRRGIMVNKTTGELSDQLHERHETSDFETRTQDKLEPAEADAG